MADSMSYRPLPIKPVKLACERRADGSIVLWQDYPVPPAAKSIAHLFQDRSALHPDRTFVAKRVPLPGGGWGDWRCLTYRDAHTQVRSLAQAFLNMGLGQDASVMVLSGPSPEHAVVALAAQFARAPVTAVTTAYSLLAKDFAKLKHVVRLCQPKLIFVDGGAEYALVLQALPLDGVKVISVSAVPGIATLSYDDLLAVNATNAIDRSLDLISSDTVARYIFTSGSTGTPKAVIHTQGTLTAQIACRNALLRDATEEHGSIRLSWMPWAHLGGAIHMNFTIEDGGTYYIDEGRPLPGQFAETLRNLREVVPAEFSAVPILYGQLAAALEVDPNLCRSFFRQVRYMSYASAALSDDIFQRIQALATRYAGAPIPFSTKYGTTEVQSVTHSGHPIERPGEIGIPYPGVLIKLAPHGEKLEIRVKGDQVTPGYLGGDEYNAGAFDEEGYYRTGDAAVLVNPDDPAEGLKFDGRVTENFKLATGTWVSVGNLRIALIEALAPLIQDAVIAGHDREYIAVMAWPNLEAIADIGGMDWRTPLEDLISAPKVRAFAARALAAHNARSQGTSLRVGRLILLSEPPVGDEIAEKGYINQRATLAQRGDLVTKLYAEPPADGVILTVEPSLATP
jgi:feruloyl-CoA synthase